MKTSTIKFFIQLASALAMAAFISTGQAMEILEYAAEMDAKQLQNAPFKGGEFYLKRCDHCPTVGVKFGSETVYFQDGERISAHQAKAIRSGGATVFFDPASKNVTRVLYPAPSQDK